MMRRLRQMVLRRRVHMREVSPGVFVSGRYREVAPGEFEVSAGRVRRK